MIGACVICSEQREVESAKTLEHWLIAHVAAKHPHYADAVLVAAAEGAFRGEP